ncbi:MAG TPA: rod shape-determining protein MreC [Thermomicrobiaceae bacterium]|nr:rod shape-determining protein MreC [Thermomicrobiaceae bacterium]
MLSIGVRQTAALALALVLVSSILVGLDQSHHLNPLIASADHVVGPLAGSMSRLGQLVSFRHSPPAGSAAAQLQAVTAERDQLLAENARLKQLEQEVVQLRQQLGFKNARPELRLVPASVIGRDPLGAKQFVVLDRGSNDGIQVGMAVVSPNFLVGQVTEVEPDRSRVTLAIDGSFQTGAMLQTSQADGVVVGEWQSGGRMQLRYLDPKANPQVGDVVVTSGKTARVPQGLVVGKVSAIQRDQQADTLSVDVAPLADLSNLQSLTVILGSTTP